MECGSIISCMMTSQKVWMKGYEVVSFAAINLVCFISNGLIEWLVGWCLHFDSRCLTVAYFFLKILYSRCLILYTKFEICMEFFMNIPNKSVQNSKLPLSFINTFETWPFI